MKGNFNTLVQSEIPILIDFHADWCGPCKVQSPILAELAKDLAGKIKVIKIDVDKNQEVAGRFQIRNVPTLALFKNGQMLWRQSGLIEKAQLIKVLQPYF
ncbi:MAG TPA: thioredoxin [Mariniphaga sp.]|nr:thioredoxin [Mariniphaga sp.]